MIASQTEHQGRIDEALRRLGRLVGGGVPFSLELSPSDAELDAAVAAERDWAGGMLYQTVAEYLDQLVDNLGRMEPSPAPALDAAISQRIVRFSIDPEAGGLNTAVTKVVDGRLDLVFRAQSLMTCQSGWADVGHDLTDALATPAAVEAGSSPGAPSDRGSAIARRLAALTELVGDGVPWRYELAEDASAMDAAVTAEADYMQGRLLDTVEELLGFILESVSRAATPELLVEASPDRTIVFEFVAIDDCPRRYLGAFQAVIKSRKLHFVGPACDFKTNHGGVSRIGEDLERAVMVARGETGPTERELQLAASLAAIAASSKQTEAGSRECRMCKGTKFNTCNACHGKGGSCTNCRGSGRSKATCSSCGGTGTT